MRWRQHFGITRPLYAALSDCSTRTLATLEKKNRLTLERQRDLNEARRLILSLSEIIELEKIGEWLQQKNEWFKNKTPLKVIEEGKVDQIWEMVYHTKDGGFL